MFNPFQYQKRYVMWCNDDDDNDNDDDSFWLYSATVFIRLLLSLANFGKLLAMCCFYSTIVLIQFQSKYLRVAYHFTSYYTDLVTAPAIFKSHTACHWRCVDCEF